MHTIVSAIPVPGLTYGPKCGSVFRTDCDCRVMFPGLGESPHELSISAATPNEVACLTFNHYIHILGDYLYY